MQPKTIVITGASDGIGYEAARILKERGNNIVLVGRSPEKTKQMANKLSAPYHVVDFAELSQVRNLAKTLKASYPRIDVLVNNAGGMFAEHQVTVDGFEKTLQVNYLAHFLLTYLLLDTLSASKATIINTSSVANRLLSRLDINDLNVKRAYTAKKAYGNAKLANILFTKQLDRLYSAKGISAAAFHPGYVATNFASGAKGLFRFAYHGPLKKALRLVSAAEGADTLVWLATALPHADWTPGEYYQKRIVTKAHPKSYSSTLADELWAKSLAMTKPDTI